MIAFVVKSVLVRWDVFECNQDDLHVGKDYVSPADLNMIFVLTMPWIYKGIWYVHENMSR